VCFHVPIHHVVGLYDREHTKHQVLFVHLLDGNTKVLYGAGLAFHSVPFVLKVNIMAIEPSLVYTSHEQSDKAHCEM
jgi:hypothetical protein